MQCARVMTWWPSSLTAFALQAWISPWLLATYDPDEGVFGSVCRVMSGFTDSFYAENTIKYMGSLFRAGGESSSENEDAPADEAGDGVTDIEAGSGESDEETANSDGGERASRGLRLPHAAEGVQTGERAPFWFEPTEVWEVRAADITLSPVHKAACGLVHAERGLSLRFPRFIRKRPDKRLCDATTPGQLAALYLKQASVAPPEPD